MAIRSGNNIFADSGNSIRFNSIFANGDLGIDLRQDGPTANDPQDPDTGENDLQNKPVLASATNGANGKTTIKGKLNSTPNQRFLVEFFANPAGENEGKTRLGQKLVTTDANGVVKFAFVPSQAVSAKQRITATATDSGRNTSEFSAPRVVLAS